MRNFRTLNIWQNGIALSKRIYELTQDFPKYELYGLTSQIRRAVVSIPSNIAEGCGRNSDKETARFIEIAIASAFEVETQIIIAQELNYISSETTQPLIDNIQILQRRMNAYRLSLLR